ncbi:hypothetical protein JXA59_01710 [Patescibacteria group bacterium]|nr:hypothetical protein [Patescibacteria group bacterium]
METPNPNMPIKPAKRSKLPRKFWLIATPVVLVLVIGSGWLIKSQQTQSACVVGQPGKVYGQPPVVKHQYAEETLEYRLRSNGQFVPIDETLVAKTASHEYSLKVSFDQPYVNPRFGSKTTGKLELLEDGQPVTEPPKDEQGKLVFQNLSVPVSLYGALIKAPPELDPTKYKFNWWPSQLAGSGDFSVIPVLDHQIPYPVTNIYAPGGVGKAYSQYQGWSIDLSKGWAEFEFNYFGLRYSPYLQLVFGTPYFYQTEGVSRVAGKTDMNVGKTLCFADQVSSNIPKVIDNLSQQTRTDFYYDVKTTPVQLANSKTTRIKIEITTRDAKTNRVDTNPFQRVEINAVSLGQAKIEPVMVGGATTSKLTRPQVVYQPRGKFVLTDPAVPEIEQLMLLQTASNKDDYTYYGAGPEGTIFTDLVNGKATVYYDFTGTDDALNTPLTFVVQPTNFELKTSTYGANQGNQISATSNRSKQNLQLPDKPAPFIGESANPRLNTPDLPTSPKPDFLYRTWQTDEIRELTYAVYPIPVGEASGSWWSRAIAQLAIWQILIILFGGLTLAWQLRKQKNKNKIEDAQTK